MHIVQAHKWHQLQRDYLIPFIARAERELEECAKQYGGSKVYFVNNEVRAHAFAQ